MKKFMGEDFLLNNPAAKELFAAANEMPIFDWHCHLSPKEIYENKQPSDIAWLMLTSDTKSTKEEKYKNFSFFY